MLYIDIYIYSYVSIKAMIAFVIVIWLGFQALAVSIMCGVNQAGFTAGHSIALAIVTVVIGSWLTRIMYLKSIAVKKGNSKKD